MGTISDPFFSKGDQTRRIDELYRLYRQVRHERRLESSAVGARGIRVHTGGSVTIEDGGSLLVDDGGDILVIGGQIRTEGVDSSVVRIADGVIELSKEAAQGSSIKAFTEGTDIPEGRAVLRIRAPFSVGAIEDLENYVDIEGRSPSARGGFRVRAQGGVEIDSKEGTVFILPGSPVDGSVSPDDAFAAYTQRTILFAADDNGSPISDPDLGPDSGTDKGTYTSYTTTGNPANARIDPVSGRLKVSTSSRRFKTDIEDLPIDPGAVLKLRPRTWRDRGDPDPERWHAGLIAEEVVEAGLPEFVDHDADGQPFSVNYGGLVVALLEVVRELHARLNLDADELARPVVEHKPIRPATDPRRAPLPRPSGR